MATPINLKSVKIILSAEYFNISQTKKCIEKKTLNHKVLTFVQLMYISEVIVANERNHIYPNILFPL